MRIAVRPGSRPKGLRKLATVVGLTASAALASCGDSPASRSDDAAPAPAAQAVNAGRAANSITDVYERVSPAVVSINAARLGQRSAPIADYFVGRPQPGPPVLESMSSGSGFFISADGHVLTNNHVLGDANQVTVVLVDGRELPASIVGRDPDTDLAVLKVSGSGFPHVNFASAANPKVGEAVIAIGNPFGLGTTATHGIISAYGRNIGSPYVDYVQLDAPINQGNSGGPTFNERGEVIGVNTAIFSPTGGSVGIGFAIPASTASSVATELVKTGRIERGYIGASLIDLPRSPETGAQLAGAMVAGVVIGGPAHRGGLRPGDIITEVSGDKTENAADVIRKVVSSKPGDTLGFSVRRNNADLPVSVRIDKRPTE